MELRAAHSIVRIFAAVLLIAAAGTIQGQTVIHGTVRDSATHQPIPGARISIDGQGHLITADSAGAFTIVASVRDSATVSAQQLGFRANTVMIHAQPGDTLGVELLLGHTANTLAPVTVSAAESARDKIVPVEYRYTTRYDRFFEDRKNNSARGRFYTREDIKGFGGSMARVLRSLGVHVTEGRNDTISDIYFPSCPRDGTGADGQWGWSPNFRLDGQRIDVGMLSDINPLTVELLEVFPSAASTPADDRGNGCGAIVIYTRAAP